MEENRIDLLTVATEDEATRVRNHLHEAGLQAFLSEVEPLRVQVAEKDAEAARQILANGQVHGPTIPAVPKTESPGALMDRAFKAAVLGLIVWPIEFYAFGLLTKAFLDDTEGMSPQNEKMLKTLVLSLPMILLQVFLVWMLVSAMLNFF
jgi:hypothetical protein